MIRIEVDYRERASGIINILKDRVGISVEEKRLSLGDYCINDYITVERKTTRDFILSIIDGRLFSQASRLKRFSERPIIVVEGTDLYHTGYAIDHRAIKGAVTSLTTVWYIPVVFSKDIDGTAQFIIMAGNHQAEYAVELSKRPGRKPKRMERLKLHILQGLPEIGPKIAKRLLEHFGTIEKIITADDNELALVEGIGKKRVAMIREIVR